MIVGERVRLRAVERADLPHFVAWLNDPEVIAGLLLYRPLSLAQEERWFENMLQRNPDEQVLAIEVRRGEADWVLIGSCGLHNIEWPNRLAELGIAIGDKTCWSQGYGTETVSLLVRYAFETLNLNRVFLRVYETNPRAIRAYEKAGFILEGRLRQAIYKNGNFADILLMGVLRQEWDARREG
jgi:RimJ/RimL family protein N-acetyltransferase